MSTPFVTKKRGCGSKPTKGATAKPTVKATMVPVIKEEPQEDTAVYEAKISVHDGAALRSIKINSKETFLDVLSKAAAAMLRNNHEVDLSCEAPWSAKIGTKKIPQYISNPAELDEFWVAFKGWAKKKKITDVPGILFRNMRDNKVRMSFSDSSDTDTNSARSKDQAVKGERRAYSSR